MKPRNITAIQNINHDVYPQLSATIGIEPHKLIEWVVFAVSVSEKVPIGVATIHYFTIYILTKYMDNDTVSELMDVHPDSVQASIDIALYHMGINTEKNMEIFRIIACINNEIMIKKLAA